MLRVTAFELTLFLLPFGLFALWQLAMNTRSGGAATRPAPVIALAIAGAFLAFAGLVFMVMNSSMSGQSGALNYAPPRLENGQIVRGEFVEQPDAHVIPQERDRPFGEPSAHSDGQGNEVGDDATEPQNP